MNKENKRDLLNSLILVLAGFVFIFIANSVVCIFDKENTFNIFNKIFTYDAYWYESIINNGYTSEILEVTKGKNGMSNWAFFPLLPYTTKFLSIITFDLISIPVLGFIFSTTCYIMFIYNLIKYLKEKNVKLNYLLLFAIFVLNSIIMFFYTLYTESLTMLLIILFLRLCDKKKYITSGIICSLLTFTKVQGCFWCIYLFIKIFQDCYKKENSLLKSFFAAIINIIKKPSLLFAIVVSPMGLFLFMIILYYSGLSPLAFIHVQTAWGKETGFFLFIIIKEMFKYKLNAYLAMFFIIISIYLIKKKKYLNASMLLMYIIIACSSSVASVSRYLFGSVILPLEIYYILENDINSIKENRVKNLNPKIRLLVLAGWKMYTIGLIIFFFITNKVKLY